MKVLNRAVLREVGFQTAVYAAAYLGLIAIGAALPMLKQGAPLLAVVTYIPAQILLISVLALPLAFVTAVLSALGRMREEGELTALQAAGVSTLRVAAATLPVAAVIAVWMAVAAHLLVPDLFRSTLEARNEMLRGALAAQVNRRLPIWSRDGVLLAADGCQDDRLLGLFAIQFDGGRMLVCHAPEARWVADPAALAAHAKDGVVPGLALELVDARMLGRLPRGDGGPRYITGTMPSWTVVLPGQQRDYSNTAEALSTRRLLARLDEISPRDPDRRRERKHLERTWHQRLMLPLLPFALWAFACGIGLSIGRGNRMVAICLGLVTVVAAVVPSVVLAKEIGQHLWLNSGWLVWPSTIILGAVGAWLLWRRR